MTTDEETEEQRLTRVKETLMRRLNEYDFRDDGTLNDLEYDDYEEYEEKQPPLHHKEEKQELEGTITEQPIEEQPIEEQQTEKEQLDEYEEDEKRVEDIFKYKYFYDDVKELDQYLESSEDEEEDDDIIEMDIKKSPRKNIKINRNEIRKMKEEKKKEKQLIKDVIKEVNNTLDDFKYNINLVLQNATIEKRKKGLTDNDKNKLIDYHNNERKETEETILYMVEELPIGMDLTEKQYDKIDNVFEKILKKVSKIIE